MPASRRRARFVSFAALGLVFACHKSSSAPSGASATALFDGATLAGWEGDTSVFRVEDGAIVGGSLDAGLAQNEFLCTTRTFGDFTLSFRVRARGAGANGGVQFRTQRVPGSKEVSGYQADVGDGWWGALYDESRRNRVLAGPDQSAMASVVRENDFNDYVVHAEGAHVRLEVNGTTTVDFTETDPGIATTGVVCLQIHGGGPSEVAYEGLVISAPSP